MWLKDHRFSVTFGSRKKAVRGVVEGVFTVYQKKIIAPCEQFWLMPAEEQGILYKCSMLKYKYSVARKAVAKEGVTDSQQSIFEVPEDAILIS